ncbi:hypothetical protein VTI28DRAFT_6498 [Corynascus sepedonium]
MLRRCSQETRYSRFHIGMFQPENYQLCSFLCLAKNSIMGTLLKPRWFSERGMTGQPACNRSGMSVRSFSGCIAILPIWKKKAVTISSLLGSWHQRSCQGVVISNNLTVTLITRRFERADLAKYPSKGSSVQHRFRGFGPFGSARTIALCSRSFCLSNITSKHNSALTAQYRAVAISATSTSHQIHTAFDWLPKRCMHITLQG